MTSSLSAFIQALPKAELHIHIEGSLEPEMMLMLAERNQVELPYKDIESVKEAYKFNCLQDFLDVYYQGMSVLLNVEDFHDLTWAYLQRCADQNVVHTEIFFDPQGHTARGVSMDTVMEGITSALDRARDELSISSHLIMCFLRHLDEDSAFETLEAALPWRDKITGVGLDSSELGHPPSKFERVFKRAAGFGFKRVAHAGEEGPPEYVWEALDVLGVDRLDHGNRSLEDPNLVRRIVEEGMALTVCPLSNWRLGVVDDLADHPLKRMLGDGIKATVNSDDPAYFGGYMNENFDAMVSALDLSDSEVRLLVSNGFEASFLEPAQIAEHLKQVSSVPVTT